MTGRKNRHELLYPLGVTPTEEGAEILVQAEGKKVSLLLFRRGEKKAAEVIDFQERDRVGDVWSMTLRGYDLENMEYGFQCDGQWMPDPVPGWSQAGKNGETSPGPGSRCGPGF